MKFNNVKYFLLIVIYLLLPNIVYSQVMIPYPLIKLAPELAHHVIIAEKVTHTLYLFEIKKDTPHLLKTYPMVSGKKAGDKQLQGDYKTPEGIYTLTRFIPHTKLVQMYGKKTGSIYGAGAFTLNYPNPFDKSQHKTGGGIWLHSTNDPSRLDKGLDSRGCLVIANRHLKEIAQYIELGKTPIIVVHELTYVTYDRYKQLQQQLDTFLQSWLKTWQAEDLPAYLAHYSTKFYNQFRGNYKRFANYKRAVFARHTQPKINIREISIFRTYHYIRISFIQQYHSSIINDQGRKNLYITLDDQYHPKILNEIWIKNGAPITDVPYTPHPQYFTPENQGNFE